MKNGFIKVCAATPDLKVANTSYNVNECVKLAEAANEEGAKLIVFPKLSITGASCGDLFYSEKLISEAKSALMTYVYATSMLEIISVIGLPYACNDKLYACCAVVYHGTDLGTCTPKEYPCHERYGEIFFSRARYESFSLHRRQHRNAWHEAVFRVP